MGKRQRTAILIGNGKTRHTVDFHKIRKLGMLYGCNWFCWQEQLEGCISVDHRPSVEIHEAGRKRRFNAQYIRLRLGSDNISESCFVLDETGQKIHEYVPKCSGPMLAYFVYNKYFDPFKRKDRKPERMFLIGIDNGGKHADGKKPRDALSKDWRNQWRSIFREITDIPIYWYQPEQSELPPEWEEFDNVEVVNNLDIFL